MHESVIYIILPQPRKYDSRVDITQNAINWSLYTSRTTGNPNSKGASLQSIAELDEMSRV